MLWFGYIDKDGRFSGRKCSADTRTERIAQNAMDRFPAGRTSFVIARRLAATQNADWILHMKDGDMADSGQSRGVSHP
jgi:ABC-type transport system involved in Fe-S cluster assembly fused permease/ATPase subunit